MAAILVGAAGLGAPLAAWAQDTNTLSEAIPLHSTVDVRTLDQGATAARGETKVAPAPGAAKPFRSRDPEALRQWKDALKVTPGAVPPASGFVADPR